MEVAYCQPQSKQDLGLGAGLQPGKVLLSLLFAGAAGSMALLLLEPRVTWAPRAPLARGTIDCLVSFHTQAANSDIYTPFPT